MGSILFAMVGDRLLVQALTVWTSGVDDLRLGASADTAQGFLGQHPGGFEVVLLDAALPDRSDPLVNVRALTRAGFPVLLLGSDRDPDRSSEVLQAGARGYVTRDQGLATVAEAIRAVAANGFAGAFGVSTAPQLSAREKAVLLAYASGLTLDAAARRLGVRPATAKTYLARVKSKYKEAGRPAYTKLELAARVREDCPGELA